MSLNELTAGAQITVCAIKRTRVWALILSKLLQLPALGVSHSSIPGSEAEREKYLDFWLLGGGGEMGIRALGLTPALFKGQLYN